MVREHDFLKAFVASIALSLLVSVGNTVLFSSGWVPLPEREMELVKSMPCEEVDAYLKTHSRPMTGAELFLAYFEWRLFLTTHFFALFGCVLLSNVAFLYWAKHENAT